MIKIAHKKEIETILHLPLEVVERVAELTAILDDNYGETRDIEADLGGNILIAENEDDVQMALKQVKSQYNVPEYVELIHCSDGNTYTNSLFLLSSDYSISLIIPMQLTPKQLLEFMEE